MEEGGHAVAVTLQLVLSKAVTLQFVRSKAEVARAAFRSISSHVGTLNQVVCRIKRDAEAQIEVLKTRADNFPALFMQKIVNTLWDISEASYKHHNEHADLHMAELAGDGHTLTRTPLELPDKVVLDGIDISHPEYESTTIYFLGVTELWQTSIPALWQLHKNLKTNIKCYNYAGTIPSQRIDVTEERLLSDGFAIVEKVQAESASKSPPQLYGKSLGGAVAVCVAARLAQKDIVVDVWSERSFRKLSAAVSFRAPFAPNFFAELSTKFLVKLDAEKAVSLLRGRLYVIYHEEDLVIPYPASFKAAIDELKPTHLKALHIIVLKGIEVRREARLLSVEKYLIAHCRRPTEEESRSIREVYQMSISCAE